MYDYTVPGQQWQSTLRFLGKLVGTEFTAPENSALRLVFFEAAETSRVGSEAHAAVQGRLRLQDGEYEAPLVMKDAKYVCLVRPATASAK